MRPEELFHKASWSHYIDLEMPLFSRIVYLILSGLRMWFDLHSDGYEENCSSVIFLKCCPVVHITLALPLLVVTNKPPSIDVCNG